MNVKKNRQSKRHLLIVMSILLLAGGAAAVGLDMKDGDLGVDIRFGSSSEVFWGDYYFMEAALAFRFPASEKLECALELTGDRFAMEVGQLSFEWQQSADLKLLFGKAENMLTLDQFRMPSMRIFAERSLATRLVAAQGYVSSYVGFKAHNRIAEDAPFSYLVHLLMIPSQTEPQFDLGLLFHYNGPESYLGFLGCYFPFVAHDFWVGDHTKTQYHNVLFDFLWADYTKRFVYGLELTFGSNLVDPIGLLQFNESDRSTFFAADVHAGYEVDLGTVSWLPALRCSVLFPDTQVSKVQQIELRWGNRLDLLREVTLQAEAGLGLDTSYGMDDVLYTRLEMLWAVNVLIKL
jgi:hypothetical protein